MILVTSAAAPPGLAHHVLINETKTLALTILCVFSIYILVVQYRTNYLFSVKKGLF